MKASVLLAAVSLLIFSAKADDGLWTTVGNGSWASTANWDSGVIAEGTDDTAFFGVLANVPANMIVSLNGARTVGNLFFSDQNGEDSVILNTGSGGPLTLDATFDLPFITVALANQRITINAVLSGTNGLAKDGSGSLVLNTNNTYTGETLVSDGTLLINGRIGSDAMTVAGGTLGGTGVISGPVTVQSGAVLAPGNSIGTLTISNTLALESGSNTRIEVNAGTLTCDLVSGLSNAIYSGTLVVSNLGGAPALGQSFQVFNAATTSGNFAGLTPQLSGSVRWKFEPVSGVLSVVSSASQPVIASTVLVGSNFILQVTNGAPGTTNYVLTSTNLNLAKTNWTRLATNKFDVSGNYIFTNAINFSTLQRFYSISVPSGP